MAIIKSRVEIYNGISFKFANGEDCMESRGAWAWYYQVQGGTGTWVFAGDSLKKAKAAAESKSLEIKADLDANWPAFNCIKWAGREAQINHIYACFRAPVAQHPVER